MPRDSQGNWYDEDEDEWEAEYMSGIDTLDDDWEYY